jgi:tetratricopeptide (TPR) repeat protein
MIANQNYQKIAFDLANSDISREVFAVTSYFLSPSEMSLHRFLRAMESLVQMSHEDLDREVNRCLELTQVNLAAILWQSIVDAPSRMTEKSAILLTIQLGEKSKNNALKYLAAHCLYTNGLYQRSSTLLARIPGADLNVLYLEGMCHFKLGEFADALACFGNALSIEPSDAQSRKFRCLSLIQLNRSAEAREDLEKIWQIEKSLDLLLALVSIQIKSNEPKEDISKQFKLAGEICSNSKIAVENDTLSAFIDLAIEHKSLYEDLLDDLNLLGLSHSHLGVLTTYLQREAAIGISSSTIKLQRLVEFCLSKS